MVPAQAVVVASPPLAREPQCPAGLLRFQRPPVEPCVRFSRTRLTDVVHRRRMSAAVRFSPLADTEFPADGQQSSRLVARRSPQFLYKPRDKTRLGGCPRTSANPQAPTVRVTIYGGPESPADADVTVAVSSVAVSPGTARVVSGGMVDTTLDSAGAAVSPGAKSKSGGAGAVVDETGVVVGSTAGGAVVDETGVVVGSAADGAGAVVDETGVVVGSAAGGGAVPIRPRSMSSVDRVDRDFVGRSGSPFDVDGREVGVVVRLVTVHLGAVAVVPSGSNSIKIAALRRRRRTGNAPRRRSWSRR